MPTAAPDPIGFLIIELARLFRQEFELAVAAEGLDLTAGEARTLLYVSNGGDIRQSVLADRMRIEPMTLSNFLDRLEGRGLIRRAHDPRDRRAKQVAVTDAAKPLVGRIQALAAGVRAHAMRSLSPGEAEAFHRTLQAMRRNLSHAAERDAA